VGVPQGVEGDIRHSDVCTRDEVAADARDRPGRAPR
jgi:hypothetical protein